MALDGYVGASLGHLDGALGGAAGGPPQGPPPPPGGGMEDL